MNCCPVRLYYSHALRLSDSQSNSDQYRKHFSGFSKVFSFLMNTKSLFARKFYRLFGGGFRVVEGNRKQREVELNRRPSIRPFSSSSLATTVLCCMNLACAHAHANLGLR